MRSERESLNNEKYADFNGRLREETHTAIHTDIDKLIGDANFPSERQKQNFYLDVRNEIGAILNKDPIFVADRAEKMNPRRGLGVAQRKEVLELHMARIRKGGMLAKAVAEVLKDYGVTPGKKADEGKNGNREVLGGGGGGQASAESRETLEKQIQKDFADGKIDAPERRRRLWQLPPPAG